MIFFPSQPLNEPFFLGNIFYIWVILSWNCYWWETLAVLGLFLLFLFFFILFIFCFSLSNCNVVQHWRQLCILVLHAHKKNEQSTNCSVKPNVRSLIVKASLRWCKAHSKLCGKLHSRALSRNVLIPLAFSVMLSRINSFSFFQFYERGKNRISSLLFAFPWLLVSMGSFPWIY